ncbi:MAG: hypothetical protein GFH27_549293n181 [Chloroflexi bacterium AL-W]|nr:hypothetical protein [Chloroflexi bacterium AL-N1]NOK67704.1 hypothetical protein [Chloroflexi bacterium AL-N10]NOK75526.1 hypothetical protein [Chloroflexi bacterium AL-N5]NOK82314.1 hypothetical protein [Chloroflexi bacterium AL-W]NOK90159.1 hypothetical protein [Chloroflexi bacterium AL-N15]
MNPTIDAAILYDTVRRQALFSALWSRLIGRNRYLCDLKEVIRKQRVSSKYFVGYQTVPVSHICGSEGRSREFDAAFRPLQSHGNERWRELARLWLSGVGTPPVELIRVGDSYFVRDGHRRVSVAAALGQTEIDATVTVWETTE